MHRTFYKIIFILSLIIASKKNFYSQNPAACNNLTNLCTNSVFSFSANSGTGLTPGLNISNPFSNPQFVNAGCMFTNVANPQWLLLNITTTGNLGFSFGAFGSAFPQAGNYDWIMWPYSSTACNDIFNNMLPPVACNWNCTGSGGTGMGTVPGGASPCNFQPSIPVVQGQQYIILITNPSGVNTPVSFTTTGSAGVSCNPILFNNQTACPGQQAVFTGTWVNSSGGSYTLQPGNVVQTNPSFTVSSLTTQVYTVTATGTNLSSVAITDQTTFTLTINPIIPISISTPTNFCYGSNATFTVSPAGTGTFNVTGPSASTTSFATTSIAYPNVTTPNIGTFTVAASYTNGCTGTQTTQVNVAPNHSIAVSSNTNVCMNGTVNLTSAMPTATAYAWTGPNGFNSAAQNPNLNTIQPIEAGVYTVTSNINFNGITCPRSNTVQVNVVATNPVTVTPNFTVCQGSSLNLTANATATAAGYVWNGPGGFTSASQNTVVAGMLPAGSGNYTATASFTNAALTCTTSAVSNVSVVATSTVTPSVPQHTCQNATINLSMTAPGATTFNWSGPNSFNSTSASTNIVNVQPAASGVYTATAIFSIGTYTCSTSATTSMNVVATSTVAVVPAFTVCQGSSLNLISSATGAASYSWSGPGGYTDPNQNPLITSLMPANAGNYTATASFTNGVLTCTTNAVSNVSVVATSTVTPSVPQHTCQNATINLSMVAPGATAFNWAGPNSFNSTSASTNIVNVQPAASGVYTATAIFSIGTYTCSTSATTSMNVVATSTVAVVPAFTVCQGSSLNLISSATGAASYSWSGPGGYTDPNQNPLLTSLMPADAGNYTATASFTNGVLTCTTNAVSNVSVVATPTTAITYPANICQNATANFSANAPGAVSYSWAGPNSFSSTSANPSIPSIQTNGSGIYTTTTIFAIGTFTCATSTTNSVSVVGTNTIVAASDFTVCAGANVNLTANPGGAASYSWSGPGGYSSNVQNPTIPGILTSGTGVYTAIASFTNGVITCTTSATLNGSVVAIPPLTVTATSSIICASENTTITASGSLNYSWTPVATLNTGNGPTVIATPLVGTTVYSITGQDASGCLKSNTISIVVNPQPTLTATSNTMCFGTSATLAVSGAIAYTWTPSGTLSSPNGATVTATPPANTVYTITGASNKNCLNTTTASITVKPLPVLTISDHTICIGNSANITVSGANSYTWTPATALNSTSLPNVIANPQTTITYTVIGTDLNGCKQPTVSTVFVKPLPVITISSPSVICAGQSALMTANGAITYTWSNSVFTPAQSVSPTTPTTYTATGQDANGCIGTGTVALDVLIQPTLNIIGTPTMCVGNVLTLTATGGTNYSWSTGETTNVITIDPQVNSVYTVSSGISPCNSSTIFAVTVYTPQNQVPYADPPTIIYGSSSVIHSNNPAGTFVWFTSPEISCTNCEANTVAPSATTVYSVTITDNQGCVVTNTVLVEVDIICGEVFAPTAFSPNGDGFNDQWCVYGNCLSSMNLQLYNRWGEKVFESNDKSICWDGTHNGVMQNDAVFIYQLTTTLLNGDKIVKKGNVTLKR